MLRHPFSFPNILENRKRRSTKPSGSTRKSLLIFTGPWFENGDKFTCAQQDCCVISAFMVDDDAIFKIENYINAMKIIISIVLIVAALGCSKNHVKMEQQNAVFVPALSGQWQWSIAHQESRCFIGETNGLLRGVIVFPGLTNVGSQTVRGVRSGNVVQLIYNVEHLYTNSHSSLEKSWTAEHSFSFTGVMESNSINGYLTYSSGIGRQILDWKALKINSVIDDAPPALDKMVIEPEEPYVPDTNIVAMKSALESYSNSVEEGKRAFSNLFSSTSDRSNSKVKSKALIPQSIYNQIVSDAEARHPGDYTTQQYVIKTEVKAYLELHPNGN